MRSTVLEIRTDFMILAEAIEFSKQFPSCHPKIFNGFAEWKSGNTEANGYVVLSDATVANESCSNQMDDYIKSHKLRVKQVKDYLVIFTHI
jgi:hypothetical protein